MRCHRIHPVLYAAFILALCVSYWSSLSWAKDGKILPPASRSIDKLQGTQPSRSVVTKIRHLSSENYTRVVMDLSNRVEYETHTLREDPSKNLPPRIYVDLRGARLASDTTRQILIRDRLLRRVRIGQFSSDVVRVVLDMKSFTDHNAFLLLGPHRLVIDVYGRRNGGKQAAIDKGRKIRPRTGKAPPARIHKIVLDPGHGGKDPGAIGARGIAEKDIVLSIAKKLARKLRKKMNVQVILTRNNDSFVPLEDRTAIANAENADIFISLHTNASPSRRLRGIESYYLDNTTDEATIRLAARENGTSRRNVSDLQFILSDLTQSSKLEDSISLAHNLQSSLVSHMGRKYRKVKNLGVKKGLFYVLVGARMPSVLLEVFFVTNRTEGRALVRRSFQNSIVEALYRGIKRYLKSPVAIKNL
ncbi:MAG: N-acetylmuramoyl-L-alanine amidase [Candidatus Binatia bacterium]